MGCTVGGRISCRFMRLTGCMHIVKKRCCSIRVTSMESHVYVQASVIYLKGLMKPALDVSAIGLHACDSYNP